MDLGQITVAQALAALAALGGVGWLAGALYRMRKAIDDSASKSDLLAVDRAYSERCTRCRSEVDNALHQRAKQGDVIAISATLAELREERAAMEARFDALTEKVDELRKLLERLLERG